MSDLIDDLKMHAAISTSDPRTLVLLEAVGAIERLTRERELTKRHFDQAVADLRAATVRAEAAEAALSEALAETKKMEHAFFERSVAHHTELNEARAAVKKMPLLWEIAHRTWHALDDGEDRDDEGHVIPRSNMDDLVAAFDNISPLDDDIHEAMHDFLAALEKNLSSSPKEPTDV